MGGGTAPAYPVTMLTRGLSPRGRGNHRLHPAGQVFHRSIPAWAGEPAVHLCSDARQTVYPRVGGGTSDHADLAKHLSGLSPRGRGNQRHPVPWVFRYGSIPAWAGEPSVDKPFLHAVGVYPRVGGGTEAVARFDQLETGLSPRGRGNQIHAQCQRGAIGSIPAWAGEPRECEALYSLRGVYPRVGGGTGTAVTVAAEAEGLSPRGRGNPSTAALWSVATRSIPAWAGEPSLAAGPAAGRAVYPRVGGGTSMSGAAAIRRAGLSPRGRGNRRVFLRHYQPLRSIPAWAGEPPLSSSLYSPNRSIPAWAGEPESRVGMYDLSWVYPRVGGGTKDDAGNLDSELGLSPRGRGNLSHAESYILYHRSIPAWAGEPDRTDRPGDTRRVYPRVGGGTRDPPGTIQSWMGLSPRGRGNRLFPQRRVDTERSIPAWAGEPREKM